MLHQNLGLWIDNTLSWDIHVSKTVSKVNSILFSLKMNKHALSFNVRKHLVEALIFPHFDYACVPLINCTEFLNSKLERALNSCIRFVYKIPSFFHISSYRNQLCWLKIEQRRLYFLANTLHAIVYSGKFISINSMPYLRRSARICNEVLFVATCND